MLDPYTNAIERENESDVKKKLKTYAEYELRRFEVVTPQQGDYNGFSGH